ncbi:Lpg1974 family pore-forming outer membrane protein [Aeoliella sp. SH292]|uniref:Lpg1974 family pore-forming outer membrane protein n=1 Tax=Aeoliella sp. SH292 TaxID=3454464 RepID=UPI003F9992F9
MCAALALLQVFVAASLLAQATEPEVLEVEATAGEAFGGDELYAIEETPSFDLPSSCPTETLTPFVDLLYWKLTEGSAENWAQEITPQGSLGSLIGTATLVDAPFDWNAGVRVGVDYANRDEGTRVGLYYTHFNTSAANEAAGEVYSAFLGNFYAGNTDGSGFGPHYEHATIDWDVQFHTIDLEMGREFAISRALAIRPFLGLKSAIIRQRINSTWHNPIDTSSTDYLFDSATENLRQNFWGIGPSIGVDAIIPLSLAPDHSLHAYFSPSGSVMYGSWDFSDRFQTDGPTTTSTPIPSTISINSEPIHGAATMVRMACGLEWQQFGSRVTTRLRVGFEGQVWLNQMQYYSFNMGRLNNLMSLQGSIVEFGLSF